MAIPLKTYFRCYPTSDDGFEYVRNPNTGAPIEIPEVAAKALLTSSPYWRYVSSAWPKEDSRRAAHLLHGKTAIRLTKEFEGEEGEEFHPEVWLYHHDWKFFLIVPPEKKYSD